MTLVEVPGTKLHVDREGAGDPIVLVHGSWVDATNWDALAGLLGATFQVVRYDRRGHSRSERAAGQGSIVDDADDLAALIEHLGIGPAYVVGNSSGGSIALRAAARHPGCVRAVAVHEPPLFSVLAGTADEPALGDVQAGVGAVAELLARGAHREAARMFVDNVAFGRGAWDGALDERTREIFVGNAATFLDELNDPEFSALPPRLATLDRPVLVSSGTDSAPVFAAVADRVAEQLPRATRQTIDGADHVPQLSMPAAYAAVLEAFLRSVNAP